MALSHLISTHTYSQPNSARSKMKLEAQLASPADLEKAKTIYGADKGDLCAPLLRAAWPETEANAQARAEWSCQQQKEYLENDPTCRFIKVVDRDADDEMIAFGRWHRYPDGPGMTHLNLEYAGLKDRDDPAAFPPEFGKALYCDFLDKVLADRPDWMDRGLCWGEWWRSVIKLPVCAATDCTLVLTTIQTRAPFRGNGAAGLILQWGLEQAAKDGVPAFLEAGEKAVGLYKKHGFKVVKVEEFDWSSYGQPGVVSRNTRMRADLKQTRTEMGL